jgi:hypothetical protein
MKYLKKFEELRTDTYLSAAEKLMKNHPERAEKLRLHALNSNYDRYGTFNIIKRDEGPRTNDRGLVIPQKITYEVGEYKLNYFGFDYGMVEDAIDEEDPISNLFFFAVFKETDKTAKILTRSDSKNSGVIRQYNNHETKTFNIIIPYRNGKLEKAVIEFWENEDKFLFADRQSAVKFKKAISDIIDNTRNKYNEVEVFPFRETLYRQLDDLSKLDPQFKFDDDDFDDLLNSIKLKHIVINELYSARRDSDFKLPDIIK